MASNRTLSLNSCLALVLGLGHLPIALADTVEVAYSWTAPTTGSPVDHYNVFHSVEGGPWTFIATTRTNGYILTAEQTLHHQIRVTGVDLQNHEGPTSPPSDVYYPGDVGIEPPIDPFSPPPTPEVASLSQNYPNPFRLETTFGYAIPTGHRAPGTASLRIYDLHGGLVRDLPVENEEGWHTTTWDGADNSGRSAPSGVYLIRFQCDYKIIVWKMTKAR